MKTTQHKDGHVVEIAAVCSGVAEIVQSDGNILRQRWVVLNRGRQIQAVVEGTG